MTASIICHLAALALSIAAVSDPIDVVVAQANANPFWGNGLRPVIRLPADATPERVVAVALKLAPRDKNYQIVEKRLVRIHNQPYQAVLIRTDSRRVVLFLNYMYQEWDVIQNEVNQP